MKILKDPAAGDTRACAAYVLARIGEKKALPVLLELIRGAGSEAILRSSAWVLVILDQKDAEIANLAIPHLLRATSSDQPLAGRKPWQPLVVTVRPCHH